MRQPRIGLALGSGSARGWSHIGVIRRLQEAGIPIHMACGASIGAVVAGAFAAGYLENLEAWTRKLAWPDILGFMDVTLPRSGLIEGEKITSHFRQTFSDPNIEDLSLPFGAVATDLQTGGEVWIRQGSLMDALRASISMPGIFTPCQSGSRWLVDGGLVNPVPVSLCRDMGADIVIAVNLNADIMGKSRFVRRSLRAASPPPQGEGRPAGKLTAFLNGRLQNGNLAILRHFTQGPVTRGPGLFEVIATSMKIMQDRITQENLAKDPPDVLVAPHLAPIGLLDFHRSAEAIAGGWRAMDRMLPVLELCLQARGRPMRHALS